MDVVTGNPDRDQWGNCSFSNLFATTGADGKAGAQYSRKTASYNLSEMLDTTGMDQTTPYYDVILLSTASIVSGADAGKANAINGDVELSFYIDQTADYNKELNWDPASQDPNLATQCFAKFYDEQKAQDNGAKISRYTVKGSDLALETMVESSDSTASKTTYWSLAKSMQNAYYDQAIDKSATDSGCGRTITLMSEVPVIDNLELIGASTNELRKRTLDVNSFDIQVANNTSQAEGQYTSGLALKNAWLKIEDLSNTTGAELAVGNNATMTIDAGGKLIVDRTCQLEIEWDGATTAPAAEGETAPPADILNNGSLDLRAGGELQNDGVITIEGTEGKPYQPDASGTAPESAKGHGELTIFEGATLTNNGCFMANGALYVQGTLINNGCYNEDPIVSDDPDKGQFTYHRGIQSTWKDDVTQSNIIYGGIYVGMDKTWVKAYENAKLVNNGDILLCPGELVNMATVINAQGANIYSCATDRATIPIEPTPENPTVITKEVVFDTPKGSVIYNWGTIENQGGIKPGQVTVETNGSLGELVTPGKFGDYFALNLLDEGKITGQGSVYKHDLGSATVEFRRNVKKIGSVDYTGSPQLFDVVVFVGDRAYNNVNDFEVLYTAPNGKAIQANQVVDAGTYQITLKGKETFAGTTTKPFTVNKIANTVTLKGKTAQVKIADIKNAKKVLKRSAVIKVSNAQGKETYKLMSVEKDKFKDYFKVNKSTCNVTVKKGLKKGTYKLQIRIKVAGTTNYEPATSKVMCKVKVVK